ncbi:MAG: Ig-like domain-containing protein [Alphaproteobacteria bacterium]|nr:Ig-like domain-containing protein [Alphaproteobacteria bacterium]
MLQWRARLTIAALCVSGCLPAGGPGPSGDPDDVAEGPSDTLDTLPPDDGDARLNRAPSIARPNDVLLYEDAPPLRLPLYIADDLTPLDALIYTVEVEDSTLLDPVQTRVTEDFELQIALVPDASGSSRVVVTVSDGDRSTFAALTVTVRPIDDPPTLTLAPETHMDEDSLGVDVVLEVADPDTPLDQLQVYGVHGKPSLFRETTPTAVFVDGAWRIPLRPAAEVSGNSRLEVTVSDGRSSVVASTYVQIRAVPDPPVVTGPGFVTLDEDTTAEVSFLLQDADNRPEALRITLVERGEPVFGPRGAGLTRRDVDHVELSLQPLPNAHGTEVLVLEIADPQGPVVHHEVVVHVQSVLDPPHPRADDIGSTAGHVTIEGSGLTANDGWVDGDSLDVIEEVVPTAAGGEATLRADGSYTYVPPLGFLGVDTFRYRLAWDGPPVPAEVQVRVVGPLTWYVDRSAPPGGDGRQAYPFDGLAAWRTSPLVGPGDSTVILNTEGPAEAYDHLPLQPGMVVVGRPADDPPTLAATQGATVVLADDVLVADLRIAGSEIGVLGPGGMIAGASLRDLVITADGMAVDYQGSFGDLLQIQRVDVDGGGGIATRDVGWLELDGGLRVRDRAALRLEGGQLDVQLARVEATRSGGAAVSITRAEGDVIFEHLDLHAVDGPALEVEGPRLTVLDPERGSLEVEDGPLMLLDVERATMALARLTGGSDDGTLVVDVEVHKASTFTLDAPGDRPAPSKVRGPMRFFTPHLAVTLRDLDVVNQGAAPALRLAAVERALLQDVTLDGEAAGLEVEEVALVTVQRLTARSDGCAVCLELHGGGTVSLDAVTLEAGPQAEATALRVVRGVGTPGTTARVDVTGDSVLDARGQASRAVEVSSEALGTTHVEVEGGTVLREALGVVVHHDGDGPLRVDLEDAAVGPGSGHAVQVDGDGQGVFTLRVARSVVEGGSAPRIADVRTTAADLQHVSVTSSQLIAPSGGAGLRVRAGGEGQAVLELSSVTTRVPGQAFELVVEDAVQGCVSISSTQAQWGAGGGFLLRALDDARWALQDWFQSAADTLAGRGNRGTVVVEGTVVPATASCPTVKPLN